MSVTNRIRQMKWLQIKPVLKYSGLTVLTLFLLFPLFYAFQMSLKTPSSILGTPTGIPWITFQPAAWDTNNAWRIMWTDYPFLEYGVATFVAALGTAGLATIAAIFASYAYGRLTFPFKNALFVTSTSAFVFPKVLLAIPIYVLLADLDFLNTYVGLILAFTGFTLPYTIWILRGFFENLPMNLEEAAQVDGCTQIGAFFRVILPISRPAIVSVFLLAFLMAWHQFIMAFIIANDALHRTFPPGLFRLKTEFFVANLHVLMAGIFIVMIIPVGMYMYLQTHLISGLGGEAQ